MRAAVFLACLCLAVALPVSVKSEGVRFLAIGDWGGTENLIKLFKTRGQVKVAKAMADHADKFGSQFVVALGDNFYHDGVKDVNDFRFKWTFEKVYTAKSLQTKWYVIAGNHDHHRNVSAQIAYSQVSSRWTFPAEYYAETFTLPSGKTIELLMLDTIILAGDKLLGTSGPANLTAAEDQWSWIEQKLAASTADWLLVGGHYPVYSVSSHGPTHVLVERLKPLLEKYKVAAYFCGHDHNMQHLEENGVQYLLTGAAHGTDPTVSHEKSVPAAASKFMWPNSNVLTHTNEILGGWAAVEVLDSTMNVEYFDQNGSTIYSVSFPNPRA